MGYLYKHSTFDPLIVSIVGSIPTGGNYLLKLFKTPGCKFKLNTYISDLIVTGYNGSMNLVEGAKLHPVLL